jgi:hypothetical protein
MPTYTLTRNDGAGAFRGAGSPPPRASRSLWERLFASGENAQRQEATLTTTLEDAVPSLSRRLKNKKDPRLSAKVVLGDDAIVVTPKETGGHRRVHLSSGSVDTVVLYYDGVRLHGGWQVDLETDMTQLLTQADCVVEDGTLKYVLPVEVGYVYRPRDLLESANGDVLFAVDEEDDPAIIESSRKIDYEEALQEWQSTGVSSALFSPNSARLDAKTRSRKPIDHLEHTYDDVKSLKSFLSSARDFAKNVSSRKNFTFRVTLHNGFMTCVYEQSDKKLLGVKTQLTFDDA